MMNQLIMNQQYLSEQERSSRVSTRSPLLGANSVNLGVWKGENKYSVKLGNQLLMMISDASHPMPKKFKMIDQLLRLTMRFPTLAPQSTPVLVWNGIILFIIFYYLFEMGLLWGYGQAVWRDQLRYLYAPNALFIVFLAADIFISLIKGYYEKGLLIVSHRLIVKRYYQKLLFIDILALIGLLVGFASQVFVLNWFKVLFLPKIYNAYLIDDNFIRVAQARVKIHVIYMMCRLLIFYLLWAHYIGIWFFMVDYWVYQNNYYGPATPQICWIYNCQAYSQIILLLPWTGQYLYTMYFSLATMNTIAYGDITPLNPLETLYITIVLFFYTIGFGFILSQIVRLVFEAQVAKMQHTNTLLIVNDLIREKLVADSTKQGIMSHFEKLWQEERYRNPELEKQMLNALPIRVRNQLHIEIYKDFMKHMGIQLKGKQKSEAQRTKQVLFSSSKIPILTHFVTTLLENISEVRRAKGDLIFDINQEYVQDQWDSLAAYYSYNTIQIGFGNGTIVQPYMNNIIAEITGGFGEEGCIAGRSRWYWSRAKENALMFVLPRKVLLDTLKYASQEQMQKYYYLRDSSRTKKCYVCLAQNNHHTTSCPYLVYHPLAFEILNERAESLSNKMSQSSFSVVQPGSPRKRLNNLLQQSKVVSSNRKRINSLHQFKKQNNIIYKLNKKRKHYLMVSKSYYARILNQQSSSSSQSSSSEEDLDNFLKETQILLNSLIINVRKEEKSKQQNKIKNVTSKLYQKLLIGEKQTKFQDETRMYSLMQLDDQIDQVTQFREYYPQCNLLKIIEKRNEIRQGRKRRRQVEAIKKPVVFQSFQIE